MEILAKLRKSRPETPLTQAPATLAGAAPERGGTSRPSRLGGALGAASVAIAALQACAGGYTLIRVGVVAPLDYELYRKVGELGWDGLLLALLLAHGLAVMRTGLQVLAGSPRARRRHGLLCALGLLSLPACWSVSAFQALVSNGTASALALGGWVVFALESARMRLGSAEELRRRSSLARGLAWLPVLLAFPVAVFLLRSFSGSTIRRVAIRLQPVTASGDREEGTRMIWFDPAGPVFSAHRNAATELVAGKGLFVDALAEDREGRPVPELGVLDQVAARITVTTPSGTRSYPTHFDASGHARATIPPIREFGPIQVVARPDSSWGSWHVDQAEWTILPADVEPNDEPSQAIALSLPSPVLFSAHDAQYQLAGDVGGDDPVDRYRIVAAQPGILKLRGLGPIDATVVSPDGKADRFESTGWPMQADFPLPAGESRLEIRARPENGKAPRVRYFLAWFTDLAASPGGRPLSIRSVEPRSGPPGTRVAVRGEGLLLGMAPDLLAARMMVQLDGRFARIESASDQELVFAIPAGARSGPAALHWRVRAAVVAAYRIPRIEVGGGAGDDAIVPPSAWGAPTELRSAPGPEGFPVWSDRLEIRVKAEVGLQALNEALAPLEGDLVGGRAEDGVLVVQFPVKSLGALERVRDALRAAPGIAAAELVPIEIASHRLPDRAPAENQAEWFRSAPGKPLRSLRRVDLLFERWVMEAEIARAFKALGLRPLSREKHRPRFTAEFIDPPADLPALDARIQELEKRLEIGWVGKIVGEQPPN